MVAEEGLGRAEPDGVQMRGDYIGIDRLDMTVVREGLLT